MTEYKIIIRFQNNLFSYYFMSLYEERSLLKQLESIPNTVKLPPHNNRIKMRKQRRKSAVQLILFLGFFSYYFMSSYEERSLLKQLESISSTVQLPPHINRLKRKLIVRQVRY